MALVIDFKLHTCDRNFFNKLTYAVQMIKVSTTEELKVKIDIIKSCIKMRDKLTLQENNNLITAEGTVVVYEILTKAYKTFHGPSMNNFFDLMNTRYKSVKKYEKILRMREIGFGKIVENEIDDSDDDIE